MGQLDLSVTADHDPVYIGVVCGIGIDNEDISVAQHEIGMAAADGGVICNAVVNEIPILADTEDGLGQNDGLLIRGT